MTGKLHSNCESIYSILCAGFHTRFHFEVKFLGGNMCSDIVHILRIDINKRTRT